MARIALAIGFAILGAFTFGLGAMGILGMGASIAGMSTMSAAVLGASIGLMVGSMLGQLLFPVKLPDQFGSRLTDLMVSSSTNGAPIPIGYGLYRFAGNIFWSPGLVEHSKTTKHSAKGGPSYKSTEYTYTCSFAVAFGEGIGDILKVWFDAKIAFDSTAGTPAYPVPTLYRGTELQVADPTIQAKEGVGNTSGYRGVIYAVWENFLLTNWGNRIPNVSALVDFGAWSL